MRTAGTLSRIAQRYGTKPPAGGSFVQNQTLLEVPDEFAFSTADADTPWFGPTPGTASGPAPDGLDASGAGVTVVVVVSGAASPQRAPVVVRPSTSAATRGR